MVEMCHITFFLVYNVRNILAFVSLDQIWKDFFLYFKLIVKSVMFVVISTLLNKTKYIWHLLETKRSRFHVKTVTKNTRECIFGTDKITNLACCIIKHSYNYKRCKYILNTCMLLYASSLIIYKLLLVPIECL